ncbi:nucleotidyltransferase domain-containing protein [bacterium]|nr:nucleotidyltransferase domain-containing protein [bacterium]
MLDQDNRYYLALRLAQSLSERYGNGLLLCGLFGSAMRGTDTPWSDLELFCVTDDPCPLKSASFIYHGIFVGVTVKKKGELERALSNPTMDWPVLMGILSVIEPLAGDGDLVAKWIETGESAPEERFRALLKRNLPKLVFESYGRIRSCEVRENENDLYPAVYEICFEMNRVICLLNRRWVTHDYHQGVVDACDFPLLPKGYAELAPALWRARGFSEVVPLAERLFNAYLVLLREAGLLPWDYRDPAELDELF